MIRAAAPPIRRPRVVGRRPDDAGRGHRRRSCSRRIDGRCANRPTSPCSPGSTPSSPRSRSRSRWPASRSAAASGPSSSTARRARRAGMAAARARAHASRRRPGRGDPASVTRLQPTVRDWVAEQATSSGCCGSPTGSTTTRMPRGHRVRRRHRPPAGARRRRRQHRRTAPRCSSTRSVSAARSPSLDDNRYGMNSGAQSDDLSALRQLAALQPEPGRFEPTGCATRC